MECPKCSSKWSVKNTAPSSDTTRLHLRRKVSEFLAWYSDDYVVRLRFCQNCGYSAITVELEISDFTSIIRICMNEKPDVFLKKKGEKCLHLTE